MKWLFFIIIAFLFTGCKKEKTSNVFRIKGLILESSGNPVPVSNYSLQIYQIDRSSFLGGVSGFDGILLQGTMADLVSSTIPIKILDFQVEELIQII